MTLPHQIPMLLPSTVKSAFTRLIDKIAADEAKYKVAPIGGGLEGPGIIADFVQNRYALPMGLSPAQIASATSAEIFAAMKICAITDIFDFSRASAATYLDATDNLISVLANEPRITGAGILLENAATNFAENSGNAGAVVGVIGAGGVLPSNVSMGTVIAGLTFEVTAKGTTGGVPWTEIRISGTNNSGGNAYPDPSPSNRPAAAVGETWSYSFYASLVAGAWPASFGAGKIAVAETTASNAYLTGSDNNIKISTWKRYSHSRTFTNATVAKSRGLLSLQILPGETVDFTFRIGGLQLEKSPSATSLIHTTGSAVTRAADNAKLSAKAAAVLQRASVGLLLQADGIKAINSNVLGGATFQRIVGTSVSTATLFLGVNNGLQVANFGAYPAPAFGVAVGWDASGKAGSFNGGAVASNATPMDVDISSIHLGRSASGSFAPGVYHQFVAWPFRPSNAALQSKAVIYA